MNISFTRGSSKHRINIPHILSKQKKPFFSGIINEELTPKAVVKPWNHKTRREC